MHSTRLEISLHANILRTHPAKRKEKLFFIFLVIFKERASTRKVGAVFNREIKCRGWRPLPLKFVHCFGSSGLKYHFTTD